MRIRVLYLLMLVIGIASEVGAQHKALSYKVHFQSDQSTLDHDDEIILNQLVAASQNSTYYEIALAAHTDADAGNSYNELLAKKRAAAVKDYLVKQEINPKVILSSAFGERKPEATNADEEGKAQNRRVEITLYLYAFNNAMDIVSQAAKNYKQTFVIQAEKANTITGINGTTVSIPANSLVDIKGVPIKGEVTIELKEFLNPADAAFNHLSTISDGKLLESGGMFSVTAQAGNKEVKLASGKTMNVKMPTINMKKDMWLFYAVKNATGVTEWKKTNTPFQPIYNSPPPPPPVVSLDSKALRKCLLPEVEAPTNVQTEYYLPKPTLRPKGIGTEPKFREPTAKEMFSWHKRLFTSSEQLQKKLEAEHKRRFASYTRRMKRYLAAKNNYDQAMEKFIRDSIAMENEYLVAFQSWLAEQIDKHQQLAHYHEVRNWNDAINSLINASENNTLSDVNIKEAFSKQVTKGSLAYTLYQRYAAQLMRQCLNHSLYSILHLNKGDTVLRFYIARDKKIYPVHYSRERLSNFDTLAQWQLEKHPELQNMLTMATAELLRKQAEGKAFRESSVSNVYNVALSGFGSFNCDRFYNTPPELMVRVLVPYSKDACVSFYLPEQNGYITAMRTSSGYEVRLPKNKVAKLVFVSFEKGKGPLLQITRFSVGDDTQLKINPKVATMQQIHNDIQSI